MPNASKSGGHGDFPHNYSKPRGDATKFDRMRAKIQTEPGASPEVGPFVWNSAKLDPKGDWLTSLLPDGRHAAVLYIDRPVYLDQADGEATLTFTGSYSERKVLKALTRLLERGLIGSQTTQTLEALKSSSRAWVPGRKVTEVKISFNWTVRLLDAETPTHHYLLIDEPLSWEDAYLVAKELLDAKLVNSELSHVDEGGEFMSVHFPL